MGYGFIYFVGAILSGIVHARRAIDSNLSHFILEEDYNLQLDLLQFFGGSSLTFDITSANKTELLMKSPIKLNGSLDIDFLPTDGKNNVSVIGMNMVNTSVLLMTNGSLKDSDNFYLSLFTETINNETQAIELSVKQKIIPRKYKPPSSPTEICILNFYSMAVIPSAGKYYLDCQSKCSGNDFNNVMHDVILENHYLNFSQQEKIYRKLFKDVNLENPESRKLKVSLISFFSDAIVRETVLANKSGMIDIIKVSDLGNESIPFKQVYMYNTAERRLMTCQLYSQDIFMGFNNTVTRLSIDTNSLTRIKLKSVDSGVTLTSMDISITEGHVDVHFSYLTELGTVPNNVKRVRWDNYEYPFFLDNLELYELAPNIRVSNRMIHFDNQIGIYIRRSTDVSTYINLPYRGPPDGIHQYTMNSDGTTVVVLEANKIYMYFLRNSAYLLLSKPIDDTITIKATTQDGKNEVTEAIVKIQIWKGNEPILNVASLDEEVRYLRETLTTEVLFSKNIPSSWVLGNLANVYLKCEGIPEASATIFSYRNLGAKRLNLGSMELSSKNTFYYEMDAKLIEGNTIVVMQLELKIYFMKCLLSQSNRLRCSIIKRISDETDMIIEGRIINGQYFMYLTFKGYFMVKINDQNSKVLKIMDARGTCEFIGYLNYNMIACSNFKQKALEFMIIQPDGSVRSLYSKTGVYSTKIQHIHGSQFILLGNEYTIDILSLRTTNVIYSISSTITKRADSAFKACGRYLIVTSVGLNAFEQFDISDPYNPVLLQKYMNLTSHNLRMLPSVTTKFEFGCALYWPILVTDEKQVYALFINIGAPSKDILANMVLISQYSYLSNYFVNAISLMTSQTSPRVIWSFLDTSNAVNGSTFGVEIDVYSDYLMEIKTGDREAKGDIMPCKFEVKPKGSDEIKISVPFKFSMKVDSTKISLKGTEGSTMRERRFELDMFDSVSRINLTEEFDGQSISFYYTTADQDYNKTIILKEMFNRDDQFTKLITCSRESTRILDFYTNHRSSFFVLTTEAVYKIKNATQYYVQNYMTFATTEAIGSKIVCSKLFINDDANLMINLCEQDKVPLLYVSNWNSLKPGIIRQAYLQDISEISQIRDSFGSENEIYFFTQPKVEHLKLTTKYQKYMLMLNNKDELDISIVKEVKFPHNFHFVTSFFLDRLSKNLTKTQDVYFVGMIGSNKFAEDTFVYVMKDYDNSELLGIGNFSIKDIIGVQYYDYFAPIVNFKCSQIIVKSSVKCIIIQERNIHYMISIDIISENQDKWSSAVTIKNIFLNYGNQIPTGPVAFNNRYLTLVSVRPSYIHGTVDSNSANLTKVNLLLYDVREEAEEGLKFGAIKPVKVSGGLPISSVKADTSDMKLRIHTTANRTYLYLVSKSYYPFQTFRIEPDFMVEIYKNIQSSELEITSVNHYSSAKEKLDIYDKFMRILMIAGGVILLIIFIVIVWGYFRNKKQRSSTMQNFAAADPDDTDMNSDRPTDEIMPPDDFFEGEIDGHVSRVKDTNLSKIMLATSVAGRIEGNDFDEALKKSMTMKPSAKFHSMMTEKASRLISSDESEDSKNEDERPGGLLDRTRMSILGLGKYKDTFKEIDDKPKVEPPLESRKLRFDSQIDQNNLLQPAEPKTKDHELDL